jgi:hypothetical protein
MITIYLSSTFEDLKEYREVIYKALRYCGLFLPSRTRTLIIET